MYISEAFCRTSFAIPRFTLGGCVVGGEGGITGFTIYYTMDDEEYSLRTDACGHYCIRVRAGMDVRIWHEYEAPGVSVSPAQYDIPSVDCDMCGLDFMISAVTPPATEFMISGSLVSTSAPVAYQMVSYTIDGISYTVQADEMGGYFFTVPGGSNVVITPPAIADYNVLPESITLNNINQSMNNQDFVYVGIPA